MSQLSNEEKMNIVNQHLRNIEFADYNAELDLIEANAVEASAETIAEINARRTAYATKISALEAEKASLTE